MAVQVYTLYEKESKDKKYREDPYRAVNFPVDEEGNLVRPEGKSFITFTAST